MAKKEHKLYIHFLG